MAVRDDFAAGEVLAAADLNDTFAEKLPYSFGTATPSTTDSGFLWYDSNSTPAAPKFWDGAAFVPFGGKILQVVFAEATAQVSVSTTTYTDTGLSATITPSSASSKVLILASQAARIAKDTAAEVNLDYRLIRDATVLFASEDYGLSAKNVLQVLTVIPITYLDSPNTTSAVTYKVQGRPDTTLNTQTATFQTSSRPRSHIILMEVSA